MKEWLGIRELPRCWNDLTRRRGGRGGESDRGKNLPQIQSGRRSFPALGGPSAVGLNLREHAVQDCGAAQAWRLADEDLGTCDPAGADGGLDCTPAVVRPTATFWDASFVGSGSAFLSFSCRTSTLRQSAKRLA